MRTLLAGLGIAVSLAAVFAGCGLQTKGNQADGFVGMGGSSAVSSTGAGGDDTACKVREDCPKDTDCVTYQCLDSHCQVNQLPADTEIQAGKVVGDCQRIVCTAQGNTTVKDADDDPPASPDTCTTKSCSAGQIVTTVAPDMTSCGNGLFCSAGQCKGCMDDPKDCPPVTECQTVECVDKGCVYSKILDGTEVKNDVPDDCKHIVCMSGVQTEVPLETETPPPDNKVCTADTCDANGQPAYVATMEDMKCADPPSACHKDSLCKTGTCAPQFQMDGFLLTDSLSGDCKRDACDGAGMVKLVPSDDPPVDQDASDCLVPSCSNGNNVPVPLNNGTACGAGAAFDCCGGSCCTKQTAVCFGAGNNMCCDSGVTCGTNCCTSVSAVCSGAGNTACCETGKACGTTCCSSGNAKCAGTMCCDNPVCGTSCCATAGAVCAGAGGTTCCETGKACGANCCANNNDGCVGGACCPSNRLCLAGTVCCNAGMHCELGTACVAD